MPARAGLLGLSLALMPAAGIAWEVAVIVNPANTMSDVSLDELTRILTREQAHWRAGGRIHLVMRESGSPEKRLVLARIYRMSDAELKKLWLEKLFRGEIASLPPIAPSDAAARRTVGQVAGAISFVDARSVDGTVKALGIDGKKPGDAGYVLVSSDPR